MGYNINKLSILQMEKHLSSIYNLLIVEKKERKMEWDFETEYLASRFAYRLRQAIHSASKLAIPPYDLIAGRFSIRQHGRKIELEKKFGEEFERVEGKLADNILELKGTDSFSLIQDLNNLDQHIKVVKLVDLKELPFILKGWLEGNHFSFESDKNGTIITFSKEKEEENATAT